MLVPRRELQSESALNTIISNLTNPEITEDNINRLIAGYDGDKSYLLGKILGSIDIKNSTLEKVLSNPELRKCIIGSLTNIQTSVNNLSNSLLSYSTLTDIEESFKTGNYKLNKAMDERIEEKEKLEKEYEKTRGSTYLLWWISSYIYTEKAQIRHEINHLKQSIKERNEGIVSVDGEITKLKLRIENLEETLHGYDFSQVSNWDKLIEIVKLLNPEDKEAIAEVKDFLMKLKDCEKYPEIKFFQYDIIADTLNLLKKIWDLYQQVNPKPKAGSLRIIHDLLFSNDYNNTKDKVQSLMENIGKKGLPSYDNDAIYFFKALEGKYLEIMSGYYQELYKTFPVPIDYSDKIIPIDDNYITIFPRKHHKHLFDKKYTITDINRNAVEKSCASIEKNEIIVQFPIQSSYKKIYQYCFCTTIICIKELQNIKELRSRIQDIENTSHHNIADTVREANTELKAGIRHWIWSWLSNTEGRAYTERYDRGNM